MRIRRHDNDLRMGDVFNPEYDGTGYDDGSGVGMDRYKQKHLEMPMSNVPALIAMPPTVGKQHLQPTCTAHINEEGSTLT